ncbi:multicopper oxidase domain-containing protein [Streptosporangium canum]|uniref:multicopper oxidase domain-containing protein n=1 Tax=Streptosporangium canum TaxID=324952 RepID=UPI0036D1076D
MIITGSAASALALLVGGGFWWLYSSTDISTVGKVAFTNPLKVPPLADSRLDDQGRRVFDLKMQPGTTQFEDGKPTETRGFNGSHLGPTLRAKRGEKVVVNVDNAQQARLPHDYGRNDIPLIVQDTKFNNDGSFDHSRPTLADSGFLGDQILVNGTHAPLPAGQRRTRTAAPSQRLHRPYPQLRFRRQPQLLPDSDRRRTPQHPRTNGAPPALPDRASP